VMVKNRELAEKVTRLARAGENFDQLVQEYTLRPGYKQLNGIIDYFYKGQWAVLGEEAFKLQIGEISDPVEWSRDRGYSVIKLLDRKEGRIQPFEEVRDKVRRDYIDDVHKKREADWLAKRRGELRVKVDERVLGEAFRES
ncbi:MAG: peptidyl-prolyl cis-trans isomerase, partial [bacterium]